jgi:acyl-CoA synthetase (AMP-forming)/AMP-acid ligase II
VTSASEQALLSFDDRDYTRADLDKMAMGLADALQRRGVRVGDRVALMSSNRPEFVAALLAVWGLGAAAVVMSPAWKQAEVSHALKLSRPSHAIGDNPILADYMSVLSLDDPIAPGRTAMASPQGDADAVLVFSSGTTGMPKAVRHTHNSLTAAVRNWRSALGITSADRMQVLTPPSHILGLLNIVTAMEAGAWIRLHRRFDVTTMLETIARDRISIEMAVAPIALALAAHPELESYDLSSVRYIVWGATPFMPSVADAVTKRSGLRWVTGYGASELPVITCNPIGAPRLDTVGLPAADVEVRIVSADTDEVLGPDEVGEIQARSKSAMAGYLPEEATTEALSDGWYRTGDIGCLDIDGYLRITDRAKEMIKVRGFQVAPAEIETVLHDHPAVADCAAFGVHDDAAGEAIVVAVMRSGDVEPTELIAFVGDRLASYKRPRDVIFVDTIPRLPSGKLLRRTLKRGYGVSTGR